MASIPRDRQLDSTLALLSEGYTFISKRCRLYGSDIFETRLMLRKAICMMGEEAASEFYHADRFTRVGAMPKTALRLLQDTGGVALLDGQAHQWRKQMFMSLMTPGGKATQQTVLYRCEERMEITHEFQPDDDHHSEPGTDERLLSADSTD
jgi:cytochrome P450